MDADDELITLDPQIGARKDCKHSEKKYTW